jgi:hypothetical protein
MPFSRSGPLRGLDAYCKDDELSEIGSQLAEVSINAGTVKPWRNSAFVLLVVAKARPWLSRGLGPSGVHLSLDELRINGGRRVACWDYFVLPQGANAAIRSWLRLHSRYKYKPELDTLHPRIEDEVRSADTFGAAPPVPKRRPGIYSRCIEGILVGRPTASTCFQS